MATANLDPKTLSCRSLCRGRFRTTGALPAPPAHADGFSAQRLGDGDDLVGAGATVQRGVDAGVARRTQAERGGVHPTASGAAGSRRRLWQRDRGHAADGWPGGGDHGSGRHHDGHLSGAEPHSKLAEVVRFAAKVLTGFPSILAGVFAYGAIVLTTGGYSAIAGAIALSILMLPTIILDLGRRHPHGAFADERSGHRHGRHAHADGLDGAAAHGDSRAFSPESCWRLRAPQARPRRCCSPRCSATTGSGRTATAQLMQPTASLGRPDLQLCRNAV